MASFNLPFKRKYFKKTPIHIVENHDEVRTTSNDKSIVCIRPGWSVSSVLFTLWFATPNDFVFPFSHRWRYERENYSYARACSFIKQSKFDIMSIIDLDFG